MAQKQLRRPLSGSGADLELPSARSIAHYPETTEFATDRAKRSVLRLKLQEAGRG
jgi:hypothetical protein